MSARFASMLLRQAVITSRARVAQRHQSLIYRSMHTSKLAWNNKDDSKTPNDVQTDSSDTKSTPSLLDRMAKSVAWLTGFYSRKQVVQRAAMEVYSSCINQAKMQHFYQLCGLPDTFQSWFLVTQLHLWMCLVRFKQDGSDGSIMYKQLVTLFWHDVEYRMKLSGIHDSSVVNESTKELLSIFYGLVFAYDEGLARDDHVLAGAVWRNLFHHQKANASNADVALMVSYIRREILYLELQMSEELLTKGNLKFGAPPQHASK